MPTRRPFSTALRLNLACTLPMLALLSSQFRIYCNAQGECSPLARVGAWLLVPLIVAWVLVLLKLALRIGHFVLARRHSRARD